MIQTPDDSTIQFQMYDSDRSIPTMSIELKVQPAATAEGETFVASRWTRGNLFFPTRIVVSPLHVSRVKPRLFSKTEESIAISQVASVQIHTGMIWSEISIDSTGGTDPITSHGHRKADALRIRELIESYQVRK
jgi:hypothetical protein